MWEHAEGMNETEQRTWVRCFLAHLAISSYHNGFSGLVQQHIALEQTNTHCQGPGMPSDPGGFQKGQNNLCFILPLTQMWISYIQGIGGLLYTVHGWSLLSYAEGRGFRLHHSYVSGTGFLPTVEDNDRYSVQYTPHHSYIPEDRLLHKHHHKVWLYPKWLHWIIIQISGCSQEMECFSYTRVTSSSLKFVSKTNRILKKRGN